MVERADVVHSHTWYANLGGHLAGLLHGVPHVVTAHSLEPRRPWKLEQLGGGYRVSSWIERAAYAEADAVMQGWSFTKCPKLRGTRRSWAELKKSLLAATLPVLSRSR